jgi:4-methyl-5(b-hydroxyethyl)-thiazole monophosphate biosynthesis
MIVLPGGQPGTTNLRHDPRIQRILEALQANNRRIAAICAAPSVLSAYGILKGRTATSHPSVRTEVAAGAKWISDQRVVVDGPIVTSQAAGTAMEFAFALVEILCGADKAAEVNRGVLARL